MGGAIDFLRGAKGSRGGKTIMVLPSSDHGRVEVQNRSGPYRRRRRGHESGVVVVPIARHVMMIADADCGVGGAARLGQVDIPGANGGAGSVLGH